MPYTNLTEEIRKRVEKLHYVESFYIHGSRGVGRNSPTSDIDYTFLIKDKKYDSALKKALKDLLAWEKLPGWYPDQTWEVCCTKKKAKKFNDVGYHTMPTKEAYKLASNLFKSKENLLKYQDWAQFFVVEGKAVHDPQNHLIKLKKLVSKYPTSLANSVIKDMIFNLKTKLMWVSDRWTPRNKYAFINDIRDIVWYIALAHYAKNRAFLMNSMKRWHQDMPNFKPNIKKDLDNLIAIDDKFETENKSIFLKRIIKKLEK